jgi:hypothetical protein
MSYAKLAWNNEEQQADYPDDGGLPRIKALARFREFVRVCCQLFQSGLAGSAWN